jgi:hypothetical protein
MLQLRAAVVRALGSRGGDPRHVERAVLQAWAGVHGYASLLLSSDPAHPDPLIAAGAARPAIAAYAEALTRGILGAPG